MDYLQHSNRYKSIINDYQHNRDKYPSHYIYELLWGLDLGLIHWDDIPPGFEDIYKLPHRRDYGIDLISLEYNKTAQVKEYNGKKPITWSDMTNYTTYSKDLLEITDMTLATTPIAKIDPMVTRLFQQEERKIVRKSFDELMSTVMENYNPVIDDEDYWEPYLEALEELYGDIGSYVDDASDSYRGIVESISLWQNVAENASSHSLDYVVYLI